MFNIEEFSDKMQESLSFFLRYVKEMSVGTASPSLIENIKVEAYGSYMSLFEVATVNVSDPSTLVVNPFDKSTAPAIEKAIASYNRNLACANRNSNVYVSIPRMTEETRREFAKSLKEESEKAKVKIRDIRRHAMDNIKQLSENNLSEDLQEVYKKNVEEITHKFAEKIDKAFQEKEKQIMTI
jgi:ribosome recycling factor